MYIKVSSFNHSDFNMYMVETIHVKVTMVTLTCIYLEKKSLTEILRFQVFFFLLNIKVSSFNHSNNFLFITYIIVKSQNHLQVLFEILVLELTTGPSVHYILKFGGEGGYVSFISRNHF